MELFCSADRNIRGLYAEAIDLCALGAISIRRASFVEPDADGRWYADLAPVDGPRLGPFAVRSQALKAEEAWLHANCLAKGTAT